MTDKNQELVTPEGLKLLQKELAYLTNVRRKEVADRIRQAREFGDISENSEYDEAKNEQGLLERRIGELQRRVRNVKVVDPSEAEEDAVDLGTTVTLRAVGRRTGEDVPDRRRQRIRPHEREAQPRLPGGPGRAQEEGWGEGYGLHPPRRDGVRDRQRRGSQLGRREPADRFSRVPTT